MALQIVKPADRRFAKVLIYGPPGQGKTHFLGTAQEDPRTGPMLLLDFEGGEETLAGLDVDVAPIRNWDDYNEAYELLESGDHGYKSVGIDSISETHIWALLTRVEEKGAGRREPDLIEMGDYGVAATQLRRMLRAFRDLPLHVFYTATSKEADERGVGKVMKPSLAGQMSDDVLALMSVAGYLAIEETDDGVERILILQNYPKFRTKIRMPWNLEAPDELEAPSIPALMDVLQIGEAVQVHPARKPDPEPDEEPEEEDEDELESMSREELEAYIEENELEVRYNGRTKDAILRDRIRDAEEDND